MEENRGGRMRAAGDLADGTWGLRPGMERGEERPGDRAEGCRLRIHGGAAGAERHQPEGGEGAELRYCWGQRQWQEHPLAPSGERPPPAVCGRRICAAGAITDLFTSGTL